LLKVAHRTQWRAEGGAKWVTARGIQSKVSIQRVKLQKLKCCSKMIFPIARLLAPVMESRDLVSVSKVSGLETLNIAKKCFFYFCNTTIYSLLYFLARNNQNTSEKRQNFDKNSVQK